MIIDAWGQHPTLRLQREPMLASLRKWTGDTIPSEQIPVATTLAALAQGKIDLMLISAWYGPRNVLISNDEVAHFVAQSNGKLAGVGGVDISRPVQAMREARRCVEELGFKAIRALPWLWEAPPTDRRFYPVYVACCELKVPFCTQIGHTGPFMPSESAGRSISIRSRSIFRS